MAFLKRVILFSLFICPFAFCTEGYGIKKFVYNLVYGKAQKVVSDHMPIFKDKSDQWRICSNGEKVSVDNKDIINLTSFFQLWVYAYKGVEESGGDNFNNKIQNFLSAQGTASHIKEQTKIIINAIKVPNDYLKGSDEDIDIQATANAYSSSSFLDTKKNRFQLHANVVAGLESIKESASLGTYLSGSIPDFPVCYIKDDLTYLSDLSPSYCAGKPIYLKSKKDRNASELFNSGNSKIASDYIAPGAQYEVDERFNFERLAVGAIALVMVLYRYVNTNKPLDHSDQ